jgi:hypothetical protein
MNKSAALISFVFVVFALHTTYPIAYHGVRIARPALILFGKQSRIKRVTIIGSGALLGLSLYRNHKLKKEVKALLKEAIELPGNLPEEDVLREKLLIQKEPNIFIRMFLRTKSEMEKTVYMSLMPGPFYRIALRDARKEKDENGQYPVTFYKINPFLWYRFNYNELKAYLKQKLLA